MGHFRPIQAGLPADSCPLRPEIDLSWAGSPDQLKKMYVLRRILNPMGTMDAIDFLLDKLRSTKSNFEFFDSMNT